MSVLALDENCDLKIENGKFQLLTGADEIAQKLTVRFQFWLTEWFLDTRQGFPGYEQVYVKNPDLIQIRSLIREMILETPGVDYIQKLNLDFVRGDRRLDVSFSVKAKGVDEVFDYTKEFIL